MGGGKFKFILRTQNLAGVLNDFTYGQTHTKRIIAHVPDNNDELVIQKPLFLRMMEYFLVYPAKIHI